MTTSSNSARKLKHEALGLFRAGRLVEARDACQHASGMDNTDAVTWCLLGILNGTLGDLEEAIKCLRKATELQPDYAEAHTNLGVALEQCGRLTDALTSYREAIRLRPDHADAYYNAGNVLKGMGQPGDAVQHYRAALRIRPDDSEALVNLGAALSMLDKHTDALACYEQALRINPASAEAWNNLGAAHEALGRIQAAVEHYRRALSIRPDYAEAQNNLGNTFARINDLPAAIASYRRAIELKPDYAEAHYNLGLVYVQLGLAHEAVTAYRRACTPGADHTGACENLLLMLNYDPSYSAEEIFKQHVHWGKTCSILPGRNYTNHSDRNRCLRVGYVSPDFRNHSVAFFIEAVLARHDATKFDVFCYANVGVQDAMTACLQKYAPHWRNIFGKNAEEVLATIHADGIDILVDLAGHTGDNRLDVFACRAAPVQVTYLGYPNTTGLSTINYRITDIWADPPGQEAFHTETLVRLPQGFLCYTPRPDAPAVAPLPALKEGHITFGSFNSMLKITPQVISLWSQILHALPNTRLVLKNESLRQPLTRQHCQALFADVGIPASRVELLESLPSAIDHLALYNRIDIALDTFPYNGTTTSCEAMWMGAPVVTLEGAHHAGRVGVSLLHQMGLTELIAKTPEKYVQIAADLAKDMDKLTALRAGLRPRMAASPLCDGERFTQALELAYQEMWRMWCT